MNRNQKRFAKREQIKELEKELSAINRTLKDHRKTHPNMYKTFDDNEGDFRAGTYKDPKVQSIYNYVADMVNRTYAIEKTLEKLKAK